MPLRRGLRACCTSGARVKTANCRDKVFPLTHRRAEDPCYEILVWPRGPDVTSQNHDKLDEPHKHNIKRKMPDTKEHLLDDSVYVKVKDRRDQVMVLEVWAAVWGGGEGCWGLRKGRQRSVSYPRLWSRRCASSVITHWAVHLHNYTLWYVYDTWT